MSDINIVVLGSSVQDILLFTIQYTHIIIGHNTILKYKSLNFILCTI